MSAETGSGKTAAFCLPMIQCVCENLRGVHVAPSSTGGSDVGNNPHKRKHEEAGGGIPVKLNAQDKDTKLTLSHENSHASALGIDQWTGCRATHGVKSGAFYFEATIVGNGVARIGYATMQAALELGRDSQGFGYGGTGMKSHNNSFEAYGKKYGDGKVIGCLLDTKKREISYSLDGAHMGKAFTIPAGLAGSILFPAVALKNCAVSLNFGAQEFKHPQVNKSC